MNSYWIDNLYEEIRIYLDSLKSKDNEYHFFPSLNGATKVGKKLSLGFSCYALKLAFIIKHSPNYKDDNYDGWSSYLNSFQTTHIDFPVNSYIDPNYLYYSKKNNFQKMPKQIAKSTLNLIGFQKYETKNDYIHKSIRAETKQAISTLYQIGKKNDQEYLDFPRERKEIESFLNSYNWDKPWDAGAQFSGLCVFSSTQLNKNNPTQKFLFSYISKVVNPDNGLYYSNKKPSSRESINGAMKVITGLDWLEAPIHYPEKLIDYCLANNPEQSGCDLVDYIYVLFRCSNQTNYKKKEIIENLTSLLPQIKRHHEPGKGFSYFIGKSQTHYYGLQVTRGLNESDIHGTLLFMWALSMIFNLSEIKRFQLNVIKP